MLRSKFRVGPRHVALVGLLVCAAASAQTGVAVGVNVGVPLPWGYGAIGFGGPVGTVGVYGGGVRAGYYGGGYPRGHYGGWGIGLTLPPLVLAQPYPVVDFSAAPVAAAGPSRPDPVIVPRNGQGAPQTEADRQECNRWATTQQAAIADASVFQRAVEACMDGRGYTTK